MKYFFDFLDDHWSNFFDFWWLTEVTLWPREFPPFYIYMLICDSRRPFLAAIVRELHMIRVTFTQTKRTFFSFRPPSHCKIFRRSGSDFKNRGTCFLQTRFNKPYSVSTFALSLFWKRSLQNLFQIFFPQQNTQNIWVSLIFKRSLFRGYLHYHIS